MAADRARRRPPRSTDVARLAGVSQKTVSRVLNDEPYVSPDVRERVLRAARELGYRRNSAARTLTSGRTQCIGMISLGSSLYGPASQLSGLERAARQAGYAVRVVNTFEGDPHGISGAVESLLEQGVDGIVISEPIDEGGQPLEVDLPVLVMGRLPQLVAPLVITAGDSGDVPARTATEYLLGLGHRTVHHVAGPQRWYAARERLQGWRAALQAARAPVPAPQEGDWSAESGYRAGALLAADPQLSAVFAANDDMAIGVIRALAEAGRSVPGDVSVVGFDDIPLAAYVNPPLTTVRQSFDRLTETAVQVLVARIEDPDAETALNPQLPVDLVVRDSAAAPAKVTARRGRVPRRGGADRRPSGPTGEEAATGP